jgi:protein-L-isoaspartate(D-aspartate) O-methyltransferase
LTSRQDGLSLFSMAKDDSSVQRIGPHGALSLPLVPGRLGRRRVLSGLGTALFAVSAARAADSETGARLAMVSTVEEQAAVAEEAAYAYEDRPLPIGYGQTISQPFIVALMTDLLRTAPEHVVLEVGTGSGYQAAVLAELVRQVHTIEIIPPLADEAEHRLRAQGYSNVAVHRGDGYYGLPQAAPFDGIIVTAAAAGGIPPPLLDQLKPGGRMVIPVGGGFALQHLVLVEKTPDGKVRTRQTLPVAFVPLVRGG